MSVPAPTRQDHEKFCRIEKWEEVRNACGAHGTYDLIFELGLPDGRVLRTRISHPAGRQTSGPSLWGHILRDQLDIDESTFWACARDGVLPDRGALTPTSEALPADLVALLITRVGVKEQDVAALAKDEAVARLQRYWTEGR